jgi:hypothetical protein
LVLIAFAAVEATTCLRCICEHESGCKAIGCHMDVGSLSCGYYQIKLPYYEDCGEPGRKNGESLTTAWQRCANDYSCSTGCVEKYFQPPIPSQPYATPNFPQHHQHFSRNSSHHQSDEPSAHTHGE